MALLDQEVVLILDDFHVVADQAIHDSLAFFLNRLPANIHLVLVTRTDPAFSLSTLRVRGQLLEIGARDLRFTEEEAASFLVQGMNLPLSAEEVALLTSRTEGWIAGLQLAALSLSKQQYPSQVLADFGGSHRYLMDYVQQDILVQLPAQLRDFLLQTSVVTRMNAALCHAVTAGSTQETSQRLLEEAEKANLFVVPLDEHRQWYRYHDLFREALQARLQANQPDLVPLLHARAAHWYEAQGEFREAIVHPLSAADYAYAADLIERCAFHLMLSGEAQTVLNWLLSLPDSILCRHIRLTLTAVLRFAQYATITLPAQVESILARLEGFLLAPSSGVPSEIETTLLKRRLELLRGWIELRGILKRGDTERLRKLSQELEALPADEEASWTFISLYPPFWLATMYVGDGAALIPRLREAVGQMKEAGDLLLAVHISAMLAVAATPVAYLHLAQQVCQEALALIAQAGIYTPSEGQLYLCMFCASYAQNRLDAAAQWLQNLQQRAEHWVPMQLLQVLVMGEISAVRLALAQGDLAAAEMARSRLEMLTAQGASAHHLPWVSVARVQLFLARSDLAAASAWAAQTAFSANHWNPLQRWEVLMLARVLLAKLQYRQTAEMLAQFQQHFDQPTVLDTTIEWMALSVVALHHSGQYKSSFKLADRLLAITVPERYMRLDLDTGEPLMGEVLKIWLHAHPVEISELDKAGPSRSAVLHMLASLEQSTQESRLVAVPAQSIAQHALLEPLSRRERQVLQLLVAGQTYAEMAQTLVVSPNTIKTQVGSIYRKLGVSRRAEAIAMSQRLHLF